MTKRILAIVCACFLLFLAACAEPSADPTDGKGEETNDDVHGDKQPDDEGKTDDESVTVEFCAVVAGGIPQGAKVSIGSNVNGWNPQNPAWFATQTDGTHFILTVSLDNGYIGQEIEYKWTLQVPGQMNNGWEYSENGAGTGEFGNRKYTVRADGNMINDAVSFPNKPIEVQSTLTCGTLDVFELAMPQFGGCNRTVRVWLPDGYDPADRTKTYSVLYMHDGQNLFDAATSFLGEWEADESMGRLIKEGYEPTIIVGVDHGGAERFNELSPSWELSAMGKGYITAPAGEKYAEFIVNTVKPYVDAHYNTKTQREYTGIGGSSMGGVMSLYMSLKYAETFGYGMIFSPALHVYGESALELFFDEYNFASAENLPELYLYAGAKTGGSTAGSPYDEACITEYVGTIKADLLNRNYPERLIGININHEACHNESAWAKALPVALRWLRESISAVRAQKQEKQEKSFPIQT